MDGRHQENPYPPQFAPLVERFNAAFREVGLKELPAAEIAQNLWRPPLELEKAIEVEMSRYGPALTTGLKNNLLFLGHPPSEGQKQAKITVARRYPAYLLHLQSFPPGWFNTNQIMIEDICRYNDHLILAQNTAC